MADQRTGRNVATAHETVAASLGMSAKTVQRARTLLQRLGMAVTVWAGRYLTGPERIAARRRHGVLQLRAASTRALISSRQAVRLVPVENVQLPRRGHPTPTPHHSKNLSTRNRAKTKPASTPPIHIGVQKLAAQLAQRMPWLVREGHIGALARLLQRHSLDADAGWSAHRLLEVLEQHNRAAGRLVPDPVNQRNPLGYLNWMLSAATGFLRSVESTPRKAPRPEAPWRRQDAERQRIIAAEDPAFAAGVIAQIRADIAADRFRIRESHDGGNTAYACSEAVRADAPKHVGGQVVEG